ncbi:universal stress protein [Cryptosporangium phraense]|uniref:Universal stress protein n=1 Tax=Cryptosporangium phraense TaxID=2593070 RepID=A0A545ARN2_9ACTN|nr:universal stress protein [Cryptosporangium phraense]TQS43990.1 universal stress protein [Cryptosporangium phraense]
MGSWKSERFELGTDGPGTIVVGIDDSPSALRALAYAAGLARRNGSTLVAVHVRSAGIGWSACAGIDATSLLTQAAYEARDAVEATLEAEVGQLASQWGVRVRLVVREGDRLRELAAVADDHHADALIVGASARLGSRLAGSLAVRLVRQRNWPVTIVP